MVSRIETAISRTAEFTCAFRAASYYESIEQYKSNDNIAAMMVPSRIRWPLKFAFVRSLLTRRLVPKGMYEYVIARTKYIDREFALSLEEGCDQVLILGAGYDSRAVRFADRLKTTRVFELDAPLTQESKIGRYRQLGIITPDNLVLVPINFDKESMIERLVQSGFKSNMRNLVILEGITMYLDPKSVDATFRTVSEISAAGSRVVFDYVHASVIRRENRYYGESNALKQVSDAGEAWVFGTEEGTLGEFLDRYGMYPANIMRSGDLESAFFRDSHGKTVGRVNGTHCITTARKQ